MLRRIHGCTTNKVNFHRLTRSYQSPLGGPAPFGRPLVSAPTSDVGAHIEAQSTIYYNATKPRKKILKSLAAAASGEDGADDRLPSKKVKRGVKRHISPEEKRRAQLLGPFAKFIQMKGADAAHQPSRTQDPFNSSSTAGGGPNQPPFGGSEGSKKSISGHDSVPNSKADQRLFASSFESTGIHPRDSHMIRDETNYDHPAYKRPFEVRAEEEEEAAAEGSASTTTTQADASSSSAVDNIFEGSRTDAIFHKLRNVKAHSLDTASSAELLSGVAHSTIFGGEDPMVREDMSFGDIRADEDDTDAARHGSDDAVRTAFQSTEALSLANATAAAGSVIEASQHPVQTLAEVGTASHLAAQGYRPEDLTVDPFMNSALPATYTYSGKDKQISPKRLVDLELRKREADAIANGAAPNAASMLSGEKAGAGLADVFVSEAFLYEPFSETNTKDRYTPTSEVLPRHEVAKAVIEGAAAYIHHSAAEVYSRDARASEGDALVRDEAAAAKALASGMVPPTANVYATDLDMMEKRYMAFRKESRNFPELPPSYIHHPQPAPVETHEQVGIDGKGRRTVRKVGDSDVVKQAAAPQAADGADTPAHTATNNTTTHEPNPHFPEEEVISSRCRAPAVTSSTALADDADSGVLGAEEPVETHFFKSTPRGQWRMSAEDEERRRPTRLQIRITESPGEEHFKPPALNDDLKDTTINRVSLEDWWGDKAHLVDDIEAYRSALDAEAEDESMYEQNIVDAARPRFTTHIATKHAMRYRQMFPKNEMIQDEYVVINRIVPTDGSLPTLIPREHQMKMRTGEARRIAASMGLDLIKKDSMGSHSIISYAVCNIADARYDMQDYIAYRLRKHGTKTPRTKECQEMQFRGGTRPHDVWHKSFRIARMLLGGHPVRIYMKDIGAPREGMTSFGYVLEAVKKEALKINAYHTAGKVRMADDLVEVFLYPADPAHPKSEVVHPSLDDLRRVRDHRLLEHEKEVHRDNVLEAARHGREAGAYMYKLQKGTAWAHNDEGMSLKRLRDVKRTQGWLPKGNKELYAARGDVNMNLPFRASSATSVDMVSYPRSTNLEQAHRGILAIAARADMDVSDMHDRNETEENETTLHRNWYRVGGDAMEVGQWKEGRGLKTNRRKLPRMAPGFATLGVEEDSELKAKKDMYFTGS